MMGGVDADTGVRSGEDTHTESRQTDTIKNMRRDLALCSPEGALSWSASHAERQTPI